MTLLSLYLRSSSPNMPMAVGTQQWQHLIHLTFLDRYSSSYHKMMGNAFVPRLFRSLRKRIKNWLNIGILWWISWWWSGFVGGFKATWCLRKGGERGGRRRRIEAYSCSVFQERGTDCRMIPPDMRLGSIWFVSTSKTQSSKVNRLDSKCNSINLKN